MALSISAIAKVDRAQEQTEALEREIAAFIGEKTYEIREDLDTKTGRKKAVFRVLKEPPLVRWAIIIGEIFHDLRSALDHAITDLTIAESGQPLEGTEFPIFENEADYNRLRSRGPRKGEPASGSGLHKIRGVSDREKATIYRLQPFEIRKRKPNEQVALTSIHALNIIDKHRTVHIVRTKSEGGGWRVLREVGTPMNFSLPVFEIKDGTILAEWTAIAPNDERDMEFQFNFVIVLDDNGPEVSGLTGIKVIDLCTSALVGIRWIIGRLGGDTQTPPPT